MYIEAHSTRPRKFLAESSLCEIYRRGINVRK